MSQVYCENCGWKGEEAELLKDEDGFELCPDCQSQQIFDLDSVPSDDGDDDEDWDEDDEDWDEDDWGDDEDWDEDD